MLRTIAAILALGTLLLGGGRALACTSCGCGDPTLTTMGTEQPFAGRLRLSTNLRYRSDDIGQPGLDETRLREFGLDLGVAYAVRDWLNLSLMVPLLRRELRYVSEPTDRTTGLGDIEVLGKAYVYRDRAFAPQRLLAIVAGARLPTAPVQHDAAGTPVNIDAQAGTGSWVPTAGLAYLQFAGVWSGYASALLAVPTLGHDGLRPPTSLRSTVAAQVQPWTWGAARLGADARFDGRAYDSGVADKDSGGFIGFVSPAVLLSPRTDLTVELAVRVPVLNLLNGYHREGAFVSAAVVVDL
jgi:hypothetical protein